LADLKRPHKKSHTVCVGMSHSEARAKERAFFEGHPELRTIPQKYKGTEELAKKLATILSERINATLPTIRAQVLFSCDFRFMHYIPLSKF